MKKLTSIQIENFRAFFGDYESIVLSKGENLLVYGENGSGKSSLFKALSNFFTSSRQTGFSYIKNHHQNTLSGHLNFTFNEYNSLTSQITSQIGQVITFGSDISSTDSANFVKDTELTKGFLDYTSLLDVYNHKEEKPNLFNLIVTELLLNYIPPGGTYSFGTKWKQLETNLRDVYNRNEVRHKRALAELPAYETSLRTALDRIFLQLNGLLIKYFKLNLRVWYNLLPLLPYNYDWKNWHTTKDFRLDLKLNGVKIENQSDYLNEARLSALSICLYLAALLRNPQVLDYKILFLDDVFIGLDAGNRIPILNILQNEFKDYQIFISTYDRHWFELAQRHFKSNMPEKWQSYGFYAIKKTYNGITFDAPLVIYQEDNFSKAVHYLHHASKPDYPAAANYFRKYTEELFLKHLPKHETRLSKDDSAIESYKLGLLVSGGLHFLYKIGADTTLMIRLKNSLPTLLHPLSHYDLSAPIYKTELLDISNCIQDLEKYLIQLKNNYRLLFTPGRMVKLNFTISATDTGHYEIFTKDAIYILRGAGIPLSMSQGHCHCKTSFIVANAVEQPRNRYRNTDKKYQYTSLENAFDLIHAFIITQAPFSHIVKQANYKTEFTLQGAAGVSTLEQYMNAFVW